MMVGTWQAERLAVLARARDDAGDFAETVAPMIASGKVCLASAALPGVGASSVIVCGLLPDADDDK